MRCANSFCKCMVKNISKTIFIGQYVKASSFLFYISVTHACIVLKLKSKRNIPLLIVIMKVTH